MMVAFKTRDSVPTCTRDILAFVIYCAYEASRSSLLIASTDSMIMTIYVHVAAKNGLAISVRLIMGCQVNIFTSPPQRKLVLIKSNLSRKKDPFRDISSTRFPT